MNEYKVGDMVVFVGKAPEYLPKSGQIGWIDNMSQYIGKVAKVSKKKDSFGDYMVSFNDDILYYANESWIVPQFKVGYRVKIHRPETEAGRAEEPMWIGDGDMMDDYDGNTYTIKKITRKGNIEVDNEYNFHPRWLELVKDEPQPAQKFAVGDLVKVTKPKEQKPGMLNWLSTMPDGLVGKITHREFDSDTGMGYQIDGGKGFWYSPTWLTKVDAKEQPQPKFQIGQTVRIKSGLSLDGLWYKENAGKVCEVTNVGHIDDNYWRYNLSVGYVWEEGWLEAVETTHQHSPETILETMASHFDFTIKCKGEKITVKVTAWSNGSNIKETRKETFSIFDMPHAIEWLIENAREIHEGFNHWYTNYGE